MPLNHMVNGNLLNNRDFINQLEWTPNYMIMNFPVDSEQHREGWVCGCLFEMRVCDPNPEITTHKWVPPNWFN